LRAHALRGQDITLIDDVATTTATLQSAAMALRQAGARSVQAIVLARAP
jgi:predicted amidophosphoribosyltransferase